MRSRDRHETQEGGHFFALLLASFVAGELQSPDFCPQVFQKVTSRAGSLEAGFKTAFRV